MLVVRIGFVPLAVFITDTDVADAFEHFSVRQSVSVAGAVGIAWGVAIPLYLGYRLVTDDWDC